MNGTVAHAVALVCHGNAWLRGTPSPRPFAEGSAMQFVERLRFTEERGGWVLGRRERERAAEAHAWFEGLQRDGCTRLLLRCADAEHLPALVGLAPAGDGPWEVVSAGPARRETRWRAAWEVGERERPDRRIWRVTYRGYGHALEHANGPDLEVCHAGLLRALGPISAFSRDVAGGSFLEAFDAARSTLERGEPRGYHRDLAPEGLLPALALRLLDACQVGWVFGGMGWWNDAFYEGEAGRRFAEVTVGYWRAVSAAIAAAANASAAAA